MEIQNDKLHNTAADSAYGGCKYRLSYDAAEHKKTTNKSGSSKMHKSMIFVAGLALAMVFVVIGIFILSYYNNQVKKIFGRSGNEGTEDASYGYSSVNVVTE